MMATFAFNESTYAIVCFSRLILKVILKLLYQLLQHLLLLQYLLLQYLF